jgi:hypothetical protein
MSEKVSESFGTGGKGMRELMVGNTFFYTEEQL